MHEKDFSFINDMPYGIFRLFQKNKTIHDSRREYAEGYDIFPEKEI